MNDDKWICDVFGDGAITADEFRAALASGGIELRDVSDGGYVPASRERELLDEISAERARHEGEIAAVRAESALVGELVRRGAHNPGMTAKAIGIGGMAGNCENVNAEAASRVAELMRSDPYLFKGTGSGEDAVVSTGASHGGASSDPDSMSDVEYYSRMKLI